MKKIVFVLCLFCWNVCRAEVSENLFDLNNPKITGTETTQTYTGTPAILIEKTNTPTPEINPAENVPPPILKTTPIQIPIRTPFGHKKTAAFVDYTTDFVSFIEVIDEETLHITEQIQFVNTKDNMVFERFFPAFLIDEKGKHFTPDFQILAVIRDDVSVMFDQKKEPEGVKLTLKKPLPKGIHNLRIDYLVRGLIYKNRALAETIIPLTGSRWGQMIERLTTVVMMPQKASFYTKELLFGGNNRRIPENVSITEDISGNLVVQTTHLTPAYADIRLSLLFDAEKLTKSEKSYSETTLIIGCYALVLILYTLLSVWVARRKKWKNPLTLAKKISPLLWLAELGETLSEEKTKVLQTQRIRFLRLHPEGLLMRVIAYFRFNMEYVIGNALLIGVTHFIARYWNVDIPMSIKCIIIFLSVVSLILTDYWGTRAELKHLKKNLEETLMEMPQGVNLAGREVPAYYILAICFGFHTAWKKRLISNNPTYGRLPCFEKESI